MTATAAGTRIRTWRRPTRRGGLAALLTVGALVALPVVLVVLSAFGVGAGAGAGVDGLSENVSAVVGGRQFGSAIWATTVLVSLGLVSSLVVGTAMALLVTRTDMPGATSPLVRLVPLMPFVVPGIVLFFAWIALYSPRAGFANIVIRQLTSSAAPTGPLELQSLLGLVTAYCVFLVPIVYLTVRGTLEAGSRELEDAGRMSGARPLHVLRTVTLPSAMPAIASAGLLAFVLGIGLYLIPALIKVPRRSSTVSVAVRRATGDVPPDYGEAAVWAILIMAVCLSALALRRRLVGDRQFSNVRGGGHGRSNVLALGRGRWFATGFVGIYATVFVLLPLAAVVVLAFQRFWTPELSRENLTSSNFADMGELAPFALDGLLNSVWLALVGATLCTGLALWLGVAARRAGGRRARLIEMLSFVPAAIPPIIVGVGILLTVLRGPTFLYGTPGPLLIAYVIVTLPFASQIVSAGLSRVAPELEMASAMSGARRRTTVRRIVAPLVATDLVGAWTFVAIFVIREFDASVILTSAQSGRTPIASVELLGVWENGFAPPAAAFGLLILAVTLVVIGIGGLLARVVRRA